MNNKNKKISIDLLIKNLPKNILSPEFMTLLQLVGTLYEKQDLSTQENQMMIQAIQAVNQEDLYSFLCISFFSEEYLQEIFFTAQVISFMWRYNYLAKIEELNIEKAKVSSLNSNVASLTSELNIEKAKVSSLNSNVTSLTSELNIEKAKVSSLNSNVASLNSELNIEKAKVTSLNSNVASLTSELNIEKAKVSSLNYELNIEKAKVTSLTAQLNAILTILSGPSRDSKQKEIQIKQILGQ